MSQIDLVEFYHKDDAILQELKLTGYIVGYENMIKSGLHDYTCCSCILRD